MATPARLWYQSGVEQKGEATDARTVQNRAPVVHAEPPGARRALAAAAGDLERAIVALERTRQNPRKALKAP